MTQSSDIIIIGAGIIGAACAFELAKKGYDVICLDRNGAAGHGSTSGSCAVIRVHYSTLDGTALAYEGYHYWANWVDYLELGDVAGLSKFIEPGCLVMKTAANGDMAHHTTHCDTLGIPYEHWGEKQILQQFPGFDLSCFSPAKIASDNKFGLPTGGTLTGAVYFPTAGYVSDPALASQNLQQAAEAKGARFLFNRTITDIRAANGRVCGVSLADGTHIDAGIVINVAGPASARINAMAGVLGDMTISTRALRQEVVHVPAPDGFYGGADKMLISDSDTFCYARPEQGGHILIGSEDPPCDTHIWVDDDENYDRNFSDQWQLQAMRFAQRAPNLGIPSTMKGVVDLYDVSDDWIPIYDRSSLDGFYMACGTSGNQFKNAPIAAKMMAELITYCEAGNDHDAQPLTMSLPYIDRPLDVGFFSRRRVINKESSFSVLG